jgi:PAS domain S-box-containing protein
MQSSLGLVAVDEKGLIVFSNLFASKMFGYSYEEFLNIPLSQLIPLRFKERHGSHFNNFIQNSSSRVMGKGLDLVAIRKDGVECPVEISLDVHYIDNQKYIVAFVNNILHHVFPYLFLIFYIYMIEI